ncbi:MAG: dimethylarginine dimethylaminohydrolase family protein, partial [Rhizomicrobium sp.]
MKDQALFLMTDTRHFGVTYQINPWMRPDAWRADPAALAAAAVNSAALLRVALEKAGGHVETVPAVERLPDLVFPANAAIVLDGRALV